MADILRILWHSISAIEICIRLTDGVFHLRYKNGEKKEENKDTDFKSTDII